MRRQLYATKLTFQEQSVLEKDSLSEDALRLWVKYALRKKNFYLEINFVSYFEILVVFDDFTAHTNTTMGCAHFGEQQKSIKRNKHS